MSTIKANRANKALDLDPVLAARLPNHARKIDAQFCSHCGTMVVKFNDRNTPVICDECQKAPVTASGESCALAD